MPSGHAVVGYKIANNPTGEPIPLTVSRSSPRLYLNVLFTLTLDDSGRWLTTSKSSYTLQHGDTEASIFTYDFVKEPPNKFPEAHLHIHGECTMLQSMLEDCGRKKNKPVDLHLPVGGRRYRPCRESSTDTLRDADSYHHYTTYIITNHYKHPLC